MKKKCALMAALLLIVTTMAAAEKIKSFKLSTANGLPDNNIRTILQDPTGYLYLRSRYATYRYDGYGFRTVPDSVFDRLARQRKQKDGVDNVGNTYGVSDRGDVVYNDRRTGERLTFHVFDPRLHTLTHNIKVHIVTDGKGHLWISSNGYGVCVYNRRTRTLRHILRDDAERLIDSNYIVAMFLDHQGNVWVSQEHYGLACLSIVDTGRTISLCGDGGGEQRHNVRMVRRISGGRLLMADNDGTLYESDGSLGHIRTLQSHGDNFLTAMTDRSGRLWLGSRLRGINVDGQWTGTGRIDCIMEDCRGRIWACGVRNDVWAVSPGASKSLHVAHFFSKDIVPRQMIQDHRGDIWLASDSGTFVFSPDRLLRNPKAYTRVDARMAKNVFEDSRHTLWIGTAGGGVLMADNGRQRARSFKALTRTQGLPSDAVQFVVENKRHNILVGTENGYAWYNPRNARLRAVVIPGNTVSNFCNENSVAMLDNGDIAIGTLCDIVIAEERNRNDNARSVAITDMLVNGISLPQASHALSDGEASLSHDQNSITLNFSTFDFGRTHDIAYSYKLEGYDRDWSVPSDLNVASYKNLPPGRYVFLLRYRAANGDWAEARQPLAITIHSPWWATWWAIALYIIVAVAIGYIILRYLRRMDELRRNVAVEKQLTDYKLRFFTNISHEFRTPLTLIQGAMERIRGVKDMPGDMKQPVSNMQRSVNRMLRLVNQLLEFRKMQNGKLSLALQETDVVTFLYNIYTSFHDVADNRNITYLFMPQQKSLMAYVDRGHLDKIVYNLLSNAFKYTPKGGEITLRVAASPAPSEGDGQLAIVVSDTGIGISKDKQAEIFERYTTGKVNADSIGIGLNLTRELVRVHHGDISYSDTPGGGSTFTVTLPLGKAVYASGDFMDVRKELTNADEGQKEGFDTSYREAEPEPMNDKRVLVVEDNPDIADMLQHELGRYFHVETAMNGEEAWTLLASPRAFDLVVSDVMMPGMSGFELVKKIRKDERLQHLPVILLTALSSDDKQEQGLETGADAYIAKPFSMKVLIAQCSTLIHQREVLQRAFAKQPQRKEKAPVVIKDEKDKKFIEQLDTILESHIGDAGLSVDDLADRFGMGRTTFYRRVRELTGKTPNAYLNEKRMHRAADLLRTETNISVSEVAYSVGITTPQYFATAFKRMFGVSPSEYQKGE